AATGWQVFEVGELSGREDRRPGAAGGVGEMVRGPLALAGPAAGRLRRTFPEKRIAGVDLPKHDHVADIVTSSRPSARTRAGPSSSGSHSPRNSAIGARPFSRSRLRWNQRRTPMSLYEPARSP